MPPRRAVGNANPPDAGGTRGPTQPRTGRASPRPSCAMRAARITPQATTNSMRLQNPSLAPRGPDSAARHARNDKHWQPPCSAAVRTKAPQGCDFRDELPALVRLRGSDVRGPRRSPLTLETSTSAPPGIASSAGRDDADSHSSPFPAGALTPMLRRTASKFAGRAGLMVRLSGPAAGIQGRSRDAGAARERDLAVVNSARCLARPRPSGGPARGLPGCAGRADGTGSRGALHRAGPSRDEPAVLFPPPRRPGGSCAGT